MPVTAFVEQVDAREKMRADLSHRLVARNAWIDLRRPGIDPACHIGQMLETRSVERRAHLCRAAAMMAHDHEFFVAW